ncbi:Uncharacterised protein [Vibrio cholerae]|nr:Uncharacterised protein [Vibrio cholerae]
MLSERNCRHLDIDSRIVLFPEPLLPIMIVVFFSDDVNFNLENFL